MLEKLKGWRIMLVSVLGLAPYVLDAVQAVDLDNGVLAAISTGALAITGLLRLVTNTPVFQNKPKPPVLPDEPSGS